MIVTHASWISSSFQPFMCNILAGSSNMKQRALFKRRLHIVPRREITIHNTITLHYGVQVITYVVSNATVT
jgi:hypothetical protein